MPVSRKLVLLVLSGSLALLPLRAQAQQAKAPGFPDAPGKDVLLGKCFQCHSPGMWLDHRQDRRGWESVLYRMVGRGALWTEAEIRSMADYLGAVYGREPAKPAK
jgi:mono/diheme cytochrome c family protein